MPLRTVAETPLLSRKDAYINKPYNNLAICYHEGDEQLIQRFPGVWPHFAAGHEQMELHDSSGKQT